MPPAIDRARIQALLADLPQAEAALADPAVAGDRRRYAEALRRHAALRRVEAAAREWFALEEAEASARALLEDAELGGMAREEVARAEAARPAAARRLSDIFCPFIKIPGYSIETFV